MDKRRNADNEAEVLNVVGDVEGRTALIVDDMIDRAGSLAEAVKGLRQHDAGEIYFAATHAVLSDPALERIAASGIRELIITNTIPLRDDAELCSTPIKVLSVAPLLAEAIARIHHEESVSSLFG
jgi:ribose-phosphate pyrophosphokinase